MTLQVYNTLTHMKQEFHPQNPPEVKMYVCGPTVYDLPHIGHGRSYVAFDLIRRYLEYKGFKVRHVQNFTDIEEKITKKAKKLGVEERALTQQYIDEFFKDFDKLKVKRAERYVRVTDHIQDIIHVVSQLVEKGCAYVSNGGVFYDTASCAPYGALLGEPLENLMLHEDVAANPKKRSALDFALWRASMPDEPSWDSPWEKGRPGWHIECSVMALKYLGPTLDIHGGGSDLVFPHHESEIMQSEAYTKKPFANYWLHNGLVTIGGRKMSKSSGQFVAIRNLLASFDASTVRFFLLGSHYGTRLEYSPQAVRKAESILFEMRHTVELVKEAIQRSKAASMPTPESGAWSAVDSVPDLWKEVDRALALFEEAMDNDFHVDVAIEGLVQLSKHLADHLPKEELSIELLNKALDVYKRVDRIFDVFDLQH